MFEFHEAFAGQILSNLRALDSDSFATTHMKRAAKVSPCPVHSLRSRVHTHASHASTHCHPSLLNGAGGGGAAGQVQSVGRVSVPGPSLWRHRRAPRHHRCQPPHCGVVFCLSNAVTFSLAYTYSLSLSLSLCLSVSVSVSVSVSSVSVSLSFQCIYFCSLSSLSRAPCPV